MTKTSRKAVNLSAVSAFSRWLRPKSVLALCCAVLANAAASLAQDGEGPTKPRPTVEELLSRLEKAEATIRLLQTRANRSVELGNELLPVSDQTEERASRSDLPDGQARAVATMPYSWKTRWSLDQATWMRDGWVCSAGGTRKTSRSTGSLAFSRHPIFRIAVNT
jgi:hypothetical protein